LLLASAGYLNAIAIMGESISKEQSDSLLQEQGAGGKVTLFWPTHADVTPTLADLLAEFFVRVRRYEEKHETPLGFTAEEVHELLA
jgi:hypothetical protein